MSELTEIRDHVARFPPFDSLPEDLLDRVVESIEVAYHRAGQQITALGTENHALRYIRSGSVEVRRRGRGGTPVPTAVAGTGATAIAGCDPPARRRRRARVSPAVVAATSPPRPSATPPRWRPGGSRVPR